MNNHGTNLASRLEHARELLQSGATRKAAAMYRDVLRTRPSNSEARFNLAIAQRIMGYYNAAIKNHKVILESEPDDFENLIALGNLYSETKRFSKARNCYQRALIVRPGNPYAIYNIGVNLEEQGLVVEALAAYDEAIQKRPSCVDAVLRKSLLLEKLNETSKATKALRSVLPHIGKNRRASLLIEMGNMLVRIGDHRQAIRRYRQAQQLCSSNSSSATEARAKEIKTMKLIEKRGNK
jgi:tetratricopeptide (TPR) repeat protein